MSEQPQAKREDAGCGYWLLILVVFAIFSLIFVAPALLMDESLLVEFLRAIGGR